MNNLIIIGRGPAGVSAAIYGIRGGIDTTVIAKGTGMLEKAGEIENYYGFEEPVSGKELERRGIEQAKRLGVTFLEDEVVSIGFDGTLSVKTTNGEHECGAVVMAMGLSRSAPKISGIAEYEGRGISYCAVCDGFFYRGKSVAVLGSGEYALSEAKELLPLASSVTLLTNGEMPQSIVPAEISVKTGKIKAIGGKEAVEKVIFEDGESLEVAGVFIAYGTAGSTDLAKKLGIMTKGNEISVGDDMATNVPGIFSAGDCTGGMLQIAKAVYQGAMAGTSAVKYLREKEKK